MKRFFSFLKDIILKQLPTLDPIQLIESTSEENGQIQTEEKNEKHFEDLTNMLPKEIPVKFESNEGSFSFQNPPNCYPETEKPKPKAIKIPKNQDFYSKIEEPKKHEIIKTSKPFSMPNLPEDDKNPLGDRDTVKESCFGDSLEEFDKQTDRKQPGRKLSEVGIRNKTDDQLPSSTPIHKPSEADLNDTELFEHPFRHLVFNPSITKNDFKKYLQALCKGLLYVKKSLKSPSEKFITSKSIILPELPERIDPKLKTLFFDLDETLIHSCSVKDNPQMIIKIKKDSLERTIGINVRPQANEALEELSKWQEIYIFTVSALAQVQPIVRYIDPNGKQIKGIFSRTNCMETKKGFQIKDLRIIKNRKLKNMIIVDNLVHSFGFQIENGIPILEFHKNKKDVELKYLVEQLKEAAQSEDVRVFNSMRLGLHKVLEYRPENLFIF